MLDSDKIDELKSLSTSGDLNDEQILNQLNSLRDIVMQKLNKKDEVSTVPVQVSAPNINNEKVEEDESEFVVSDIYELEDKNEYEVFDTIEEENNTYLLLAQVGNLRNIVIRNLVYNTVNGEEHLERLDSSKFNEIFEKFIKKNKDLLK